MADEDVTEIDQTTCQCVDSAGHRLKRPHDCKANEERRIRLAIVEAEADGIFDPARLLCRCNYRKKPLKRKHFCPTVGRIVQSMEEVTIKRNVRFACELCGALKYKSYPHVCRSGYSCFRCGSTIYSHICSESSRPCKLCGSKLLYHVCAWPSLRTTIIDGTVIRESRIPI
jgi:hypothetical protein